jgi:hypothetical protein
MAEKLAYDQLVRLLGELNAKLKERDLSVTLNVYGGFVMCAYGIRITTSDIDVTYDNAEADIEQAAKEVAGDNGISGAWLNNAVRDIVLEDMIKQEMYEFRRFSNLAINFPSDKQLLAMKLFAARMAKDAGDAAELARRLGINTEAGLDTVLKEFFGVESVRNRNKLNNNLIGRFERAVIHKIKE